MTFAYQPGAAPVLQDVDLELIPGELLAVVDPTGAGKSTLLRLLLGFKQPQQGSICYDQMPLNELDLGHLRRQLGVVLQDAQLFPGCLRDAIAGAQDLSEEQIWEALSRSARSNCCCWPGPWLANPGPFRDLAERELVH